MRSLKTFIRRLSGAAGVEFRASRADAILHDDIVSLGRDLTAQRQALARLEAALARAIANGAGIASNAARTADRLDKLARFAIAANWHVLDRIEALTPPAP